MPPPAVPSHRVDSVSVQRLLLLSVLLLGATSSAAEELWIVPEPLSPAAGEEVRVRLMAGQAFAGRELSVADAGAARFQRVWKNGRVNLSVDEDGAMDTRFRPEAAGIQLIAFSSEPMRSDKSETETRFCKALVVVGKPEAGSPLRWSELGQRLEIVPQTDPVLLLERGGRLELQILFEREPLAGVRVHALPGSAPQGGGKRARTDEIGLTRFSLDRPGPWLIRVEHRARAKDGWDHLVATLVLNSGASTR